MRDACATAPEAELELSVLDTKGDVKEPTPLVFIEGWAAGTSPKIFNGLDDQLNEGKPLEAQNRRLLVIKCGCYSSIWDRAHEIYYALKGGRCDYGEEHSRIHGHARYGRTHERGLYENWSEDYPLHFAGHSFGGATIFHLQQLLGTVLEGSPASMKSIITISSPLRGTPLAAALGQLHGPNAGQKRFSIGWMLAVGVHFAKTANLIGNELYDFGGDHFMTNEKDENASKYGMVDAFCDYLAGKSIGFSADSAGYDMLMESMEQHNVNSKLCTETFYRAHTASTPLPIYLPPLAYTHYLVSKFPHQHTYDPEWQENDGFIPLKSQMHPTDCAQTTCLHIPQPVSIHDEPPPIPGVWHVKHHPDTTHFGLVDYLWKLHASKKSRTFWNELGGWIRNVDQVHASRGQENVKAVSVSIVEA